MTANQKEQAGEPSLAWIATALWVYPLLALLRAFSACLMWTERK